VSWLLCALIRPIGAPSAIDSSTSRSAERAAPIGHFPDQSLERSDERGTSGVGGRFSEDVGQLVVALLQFEAADEHGAIALRESKQGRFVTFHLLTADGAIQRRFAGIRLLFGQRRHERPAAHAARVILDLAVHRFAQVRHEGAGAIRRECGQVSQCAEGGVLHDVEGVDEIARPDRQTAAGPAPERRQASGEQLLLRGGIASFGTVQQRGRRIDWRVLSHGAYWVQRDSMPVRAMAGREPRGPALRRVRHVRAAVSSIRRVSVTT